MLNENQQFVFGELNQKGYNLGNENEFLSAMNDEANRKWAYDSLRESGIDMGEYGEFEKAIMPAEEKKQAWWKSAGKALGSGLLRAMEGLGRSFDQMSSGMLIEAPYGSDKAYIQNPTNDEKRAAAETVKQYEEGLAQLSEEERKKWQEQPLPENIREAYDKSTITRGLDKVEQKQEQLAKSARKNVGDANFTDLIAERRFGDAFELGMITALESAPQMVMGMNVPGRILLGTITAADEFDRLTKERPDMSVTARAAQATMAGALEQFFESKFNPLKLEGKLAKGTISELIKSGRKLGGKEIVKDLGRIFKAWGIDAAGEGLEEVLTTMSTDMVKYVIGWMDEDGESFQKLYEEAAAEAAEQGKELSEDDFRRSIAMGLLNDFIGGAMAGGYMGGASHGINGVRVIASDIKADSEWNKLSKEDKAKRINEAEIASEAVDEMAKRRGKSRKEVLSELDKAAEMRENGALDAEHSSLLDDFTQYSQGIRQARAEEEEANQNTPETPNAQEAAKEEAPKAGKGEKAEDREVTLDDGKKVTFTGMSVVYNEDGSINWEQSRGIFIKDADSNLIVGDHTAMHEAIDEALRTEKKNGEELMKHDVPVEPISEEEAQVAEAIEEEVQKTPEEIAAEEAAAAEAAEQERIDGMYAAMQEAVSQKGLEVLSKLSPEQKFVWTMKEDGLEAALEDAQAYLEQASQEKDPTTRRAKMKQWQSLIDQYGQKTQESAEKVPENLDNSEKSSTFAPNSESNDDRRVQPSDEGGNPAPQPEPEQGGLGGDRAGVGEDNGGNDGGGNAVGVRSGFVAVDSLEGLNEDIDKVMRAKGVKSPDVRVVRVSAQDFHDAIAAGRKKNANGWRVDVKSVEDLEHCYCMLTPDGAAGIAVKPDGDIVSLFSDQTHKGVYKKLLLMAIANGGRKADFFMSPNEGVGLQNLYWRLGARITGQNPFSEEVGRQWVDGWVEYYDKLVAEFGEEEGRRRALNHQTAAAVFPATVEEALEAYAERQGKNIEDEVGTEEIAEGQTGLKGVPVYDDYDKMIDARDAELAEAAQETKEPSETIDLSGEDVVLMYNRGDSQYVFCKKNDDGKLIRLDNGKELSDVKGWSEVQELKKGEKKEEGKKYKTTVFYNGVKHYMLGSTSSLKTVNLVPVDTTIPVCTNTRKGGNHDSIVRADKKEVKDEKGNPLFGLNRREEKLDKLLKEAKTIDDVLDYVVFDRKQDDGTWYEFTLRELLDMVTVFGSDNKRKYIGDEKFKRVFELLMDKFYGEQKVIDNFRKNGTLEDETIAVLTKAVNEAGRAWNQLFKDNQVKPGKGFHLTALSASLRNLVKAMAASTKDITADDIEKGETASGNDVLKKTEVKEKRTPTAEDFAKKDALREQLKKVATPTEMAAINEEIKALLSEVDFSKKEEAEESQAPKVESQESQETPKEEAKPEAGAEELSPLQLLEKERDRAVEMLETARKRGNKEMEEMLLEKVNDLGKRIFEANQKAEFAMGEGGVTSGVVQEAGARVVKTLNDVGIEAEVIDEAQLPEVLNDKEVQELKTSKGVVYGLKKGKKIYVVRERMNPNTPIHEYGHLWVDMIRKEDPKLWKGIKNMLKDTKMWQEVLKDEKYAKIRDNEEMMASEVMSRLLGMRFGEVIDTSGKTRFDEMMEQAKSNKEKSLLISLRKKIDEFVIKVLGMFGIEIKSEKRFWNMVDKVLHMPMEDLARWSAAIETNTEFDVRAEEGSKLTEEEKTIKAEAEKRGDFMQAPDGTPTKLTEKQWCQVRTEAFKRWAGDWQNGEARIFLDANGEPKVLYHGTRQFGFRSFDTSKSTSANAIFFADSEDVAKGYAGLMSKISHLGEEKQKVTTKDVLDVLFSEDVPLAQALDVIARYADCTYEYDEDGTTLTITPLATQDPFEIYIPGTSKAEARKMIEENLDMDIPAMQMTAGTKNGGIYATFVRAENVLEIDAKGEMWDEIPTDAIPGYPDTGERVVDTNWIAAWAKDQGYDGVIVRNTWDTAGEDIGLFSDKSFDEYISLRDKGDIKSATDNKGTFDETNEDIEYQLGEDGLFGTEAEMMVGDPDPRNISQEVKEAMGKRKEAVQKKNENVHTKPAERLEGSAKLIYQVLDNTHGLYLLQGKINAWRKAHGMSPIPDSMDVRSLLNRCGSAIASRVTLFEHRQEKKLKEVTDSLAEKVAKSKLMERFAQDLLEEEKADGTKFHYIPTAQDLLERYLVARDNIERAERGIPTRGEREFTERMGMSMAEYAELFQSYFTDADLKALWGAVRACTNTSLKELLRGGRISREDYDAYMERQFYVPEKDFAERETNEDLAEDEEKERKGKNRRATAVEHKAEGGESLATNILAHIVSDVKNSIAVAQENLVKKAMFDLMNDNLAYSEEYGIPRPARVWYVKTGTNANGEPIYERTTERPAQEMIEEAEMIKKLIKEQQERLRNEKDESKREQIKAAIEYLKGELPIVSAKQAGDGNLLEDRRDDVPTVKVYVNGVQHEMTFNGMEEVADALNGEYDLRGNNTNIRKANALIASMFTTYNPTFFAVNLARDTPYILAKGYSQYGLEFVGAFGKALTSEGKSTRKPILQYLNGKLDESTPEGRMFYNFLMGGGNTGYTQLKNIREIKKDFEGSAFGKTRIGQVFDIGAKLNEYSELLTRFAAYKAMIETGHSENEALNAAKNLSVNFNRRGAGNKFLNYFNSLSMFSNAAIQGASGFFRSFDNGKNIGRGLFGLVFMPAFLGFINTLLCPDDDDDEFVVSEYYRDNYCVLGGVKIPLPEQFRPFWAMGVNIAMGMQGRRDAGQIANSLLQSFTQYLMPVPPAVSQAAMKAEGALFGESQGLVDAADVASTLMLPQFASGVSEIAHNKDFMGNTIRKYDLDAVPQYKLGENEAALYQDIAKFFYWANGGDTQVPLKYKKGSIDKEVGRWYVPLPANVNPKEVHKGMGVLIPAGWLNIACSIYGFSKDAIEGVVKGEWGDNLRAKDVPLVGTFYRPEDETMFRYSLYKEMKRITGAYDAIAKEVQKQDRMSDEEHHAAIIKEMKDKVQNSSERGFNPEYWKQLEEAYKATSVYDIAHKLGKTEEELRKEYPELESLGDFQKMISQEMNKELMEYHGIEHHVPWLQEQLQKVKVWKK